MLSAKIDIKDTLINECLSIFQFKRMGICAFENDYVKTKYRKKQNCATWMQIAL